MKKILLLSSLAWGSPYVLLDQFHGIGLGYENSKGDLFLAFGGSGWQSRDDNDSRFDPKLSLGLNCYLENAVHFPVFIGGALDVRNAYTHFYREESDYYFEYSLSLGLKYPIMDRLRFYGYENIYFHSFRNIYTADKGDDPAIFFNFSPNFGFSILF